MFLKSLLCLISSTVSFSIYAQNENEGAKKIDLFTSFGVLYTNDIKFTNGSSDFGLELSLSGLYSFPSLKSVTPVIGGGLHSSVFTKKLSQDAISIILPHDSELNVSWASLEANAGVKLNPIAKLNLFTLVNLGYAPLTKTTFGNSNFEIGSTSKNHSYYGATVIGTVPLTEAMSIGGSFTYNRHNMSSKKIIGKTISFINQYTTALVLQFSI
ncbi:hypothetical protein [Fluviispira sanaruensis]|uniref:Outer membrane protein beta-barrel domain-containing protein n=1 Tax=Fluviispira sanaruensis TaxID=2493639 RepID=A0A4P2VIU8_FLUSA|nr:hypothetical protein [Fluviispira sanaruensis]BBH52368.1 hypothetical protein JCM31447_08090 [Fluviispira sanaruensis]